MRRLPLSISLLALLLPCCYDFHLTGPEDAPVVATPGVVSVSVEYRQPNGCLGGSNCDAAVVFFGSWMRPGGEFRLTRAPGSLVWTGVAQGVPVNYPPRDDPYSVRIYDPFLVESCSDGFSAERIRLGGESLVRFEGGGCRDQAALVYVDDNGRGHNPY